MKRIHVVSVNNHTMSGHQPEFSEIMKKKVESMTKKVWDVLFGIITKQQTLLNLQAELFKTGYVETKLNQHEFKKLEAISLLKDNYANGAILVDYLNYLDNELIKLEKLSKQLDLDIEFYQSCINHAKGYDKLFTC